MNLETNWMGWSIGLAVAVGIWLVGWMVRRWVLPWLLHLFRKTPTDLDDILIASLKPHVPLWFLVLGVTIGARFAAVPAYALVYLDRAAQVVWILSFTFAAATFLTGFVISRTAKASGGAKTTTLTQNAIRIVVIGLGAMVVLSQLGIAITPVLTALGVGSLAVALALQPTLANMFAGFHITLASKVRVGDYIELDSGEKGFVTDIGWRSTSIRALPNNIVLVPNSRLAEVIVTNYSLPENEQATLIQVGVSYDSDLEQVEKVTLEVARSVQRDADGGVTEFEPFIRYHTFGDSSINFTVILRVRQFTDRYLVRHEFVKRLHRRYAETGIEIPFPQRVVHMAQAGQQLGAAD